ncbi:peptidase [Acrocarpospora phusangensis]|uniref:Peptidase n=1 Tax=Acrocarpospora phusangensis TaxID=1070424 RepID=A0A919USQ2_9ACTN|nr:trypsin-like serine protease [Acrocarpospora phusangensis]GIH28893.1 peptidase [Acrocarpospora phusangensis]
MSRRTPLSALGVSVAAVLATSLVSSAPALAQTRQATVLPSDVITYALGANATDLQRIAAYWTPERLRQASTYVPSTKPSAGTRSAPSVAEVVPGGKRARTAKAPGKKAAQNPPMVGKVFFKLGAKEYWCSGSVVHSKNRNLVATAGHCGYSLPQNRPVENWIFIPSYENGDTNAGIYVGHTLYLHLDYPGKGDFDRDYAFVTVNRGFTWKNTSGGYQRADAGRLEDKVGAFRFAATKGTSLAVNAFGYPAGAHPDGSRPYSGQTVRTCSGVTDRKYVTAPTYLLSHGVLLRSCMFTAGASGGPWVLNYNRARQTGFLNGVTSLTWNVNGDGRLDAISTPFFNAVTQRVYNEAAKQATG